MAQDKVRVQKRLAQKHLYSRVSYLYQAAINLARTTYNQQRSDAMSSGGGLQENKIDDHLYTAVTASASEASPNTSSRVVATHQNTEATTASSLNLSSSLSRYLLGHLRAVSLKSQIRLSPTMKHSICKRCDALLLPGFTSICRLENNSRGGRKPWADVIVLACNACGIEKRFPVGAKRQLKKVARRSNTREEIAEGRGKHDSVE